jgi:hypothetical protein
MASVGAFFFYSAVLWKIHRNVDSMSQIASMVVRLGHFDAGDAYDRNRLQHRDQYSDRLDLVVRGGDARATEVLTLSHLGVGQDCKNPKRGHDGKSSRSFAMFAANRHALRSF